MPRKPDDFHQCHLADRHHTLTSARSTQLGGRFPLSISACLSLLGAESLQRGGGGRRSSLRTTLYPRPTRIPKSQLRVSRFAMAHLWPQRRRQGQNREESRYSE